MSTASFDWNRFNNSQFYGHPKNSNWAKYPHWKNEVIPSNSNAWTAELGDVRQAHKLVGFKGGVWECACGVLDGEDWMTHLKKVVSEYERNPK